MTMRSRKKEPTLVSNDNPIHMVKKGDPDQISRILESIMTEEKDRKFVKKKPSKPEWHSRVNDHDEQTSFNTVNLVIRQK